MTMTSVARAVCWCRQLWFPFCATVASHAQQPMALVGESRLQPVLNESISCSLRAFRKQDSKVASIPWAAVKDLPLNSELSRPRLDDRPLRVGPAVDVRKSFSTHPTNQTRIALSANENSHWLAHRRRVAPVANGPVSLTR